MKVQRVNNYTAGEKYISSMEVSNKISKNFTLAKSTCYSVSYTPGIKKIVPWYKENCAMV